MPFTDLEDKVVNATSRFPRRRCKLSRERYAGSLREGCTSIEEFKEKIASQSGEHNIIFGLQIGGVGLSLLVGVAFGTECSIICGEVVGPPFTPFLVRSRRARERAGGQLNHRHGFKIKRSQIPKVTRPQSRRVRDRASHTRKFLITSAFHSSPFAPRTNMLEAKLAEAQTLKKLLEGTRFGCAQI